MYRSRGLNRWRLNRFAVAPLPLGWWKRSRRRSLRFIGLQGIKPENLSRFLSRLGCTTARHSGQHGTIKPQ